jgi:hypothetical protein
VGPFSIQYISLKKHHQKCARALIRAYSQLLSAGQSLHSQLMQAEKW